MESVKAGLAAPGLLSQMGVMGLQVKSGEVMAGGVELRDRVHDSSVETAYVA